MKRFDLWSMILRAPEDEGGAGGETVLGGGPDANVLFPNDATGDKGADTLKGGEGNDTLPGGVTDWKEYENDPAKSAEENAAAKAEHDKAKPAEKKADDKGSEVPADGKYDLKMPDGVELDAELATALGPEFKDLGLTNAQAQKLVDKYISIQQGRMEAHAKSPAGAMATIMGEYFNEAGTPDTWMDKAKADKEIGGANWSKTETNALRFMKHVNDPSLNAYLNASFGGNHPALIKAFAKAGELIREDDPASGGAGGAGKPADAAYTLFPSDAPKG